MTRSHRLLFCFSLLCLQAIEPRGKLFDLARQGQYAQFVIAEADSSSFSRRITSRNSRFIESGPSARCLPPVTVTLWKHSPDCERKNASGFDSASSRAEVGSGTM